MVNIKIQYYTLCELPKYIDIIGNDKYDDSIPGQHVTKVQFIFGTCLLFVFCLKILICFIQTRFHICKAIYCTIYISNFNELIVG